MKIEIIKSISSLDQSHIFNIWNSVYPSQAVFKTEKDFKTYLDKTSNKTHFVCRNTDATIDGWLMTFTRDDERFFVLLVAKNKQSAGIGTILVEEMKQVEDKIAGWVVESDDYLKADGSLYHSPIGFYKKLGFTITAEKIEKNDLSLIRIIWCRVS